LLSSTYSRPFMNCLCHSKIRVHDNIITVHLL
jgi:hypothetical protein